MWRKIKFIGPSHAKSEEGERSVSFERNNNDVKSLSCSSYKKVHSVPRPFAYNGETEEMMDGWMDGRTY